MKLSTLQEKLQAHFRSFRRQKRKYDKTGKKGHLKEARKHKGPIKKLKELIAKLKARLRNRKVDWNGHPALSSPGIKKAARVALSVPDLYITSTTDGVHSPTSWHYKGRAFDGGSGSSSETPEKRAQQKLLNELGTGYFAELFGPLPWYVKNGILYKGSVFPGHSDHLHVAVA